MALFEQGWLALLVSLGESAPFVILGLLLAGLIREFIPAATLKKRGKRQHSTRFKRSRTWSHSAYLLLQHNSTWAGDDAFRRPTRHCVCLYDECPCDLTCDYRFGALVAGPGLARELHGRCAVRVVPDWVDRK